MFALVIRILDADGSSSARKALSPKRSELTLSAEFLSGEYSWTEQQTFPAQTRF